VSGSLTSQQVIDRLTFLRATRPLVATQPAQTGPSSSASSRGPRSSLTPRAPSQLAAILADEALGNRLRHEARDTVANAEGPLRDALQEHFFDLPFAQRPTENEVITWIVDLVRYSELRLEPRDATLWLANANWDLGLAMASYLEERDLEDESTGLSEAPSDRSPGAEVTKAEGGEEGEDEEDEEEGVEESEVGHWLRSERIVTDDGLGRREQPQPNECGRRPLSSGQRPTGRQQEKHYSADLRWENQRGAIPGIRQLERLELNPRSESLEESILPVLSSFCVLFRPKLTRWIGAISALRAPIECRCCRLKSGS